MQRLVKRGFRVRSKNAHVNALAHALKNQECMGNGRVRWKQDQAPDDDTLEPVSAAILGTGGPNVK